MQTAEKHTPSYTKIQNYVLEKIRNGEYPVGSKIPSEVELAAQFSVSRITANMAIKELSVMGILERTRGKGSFVCAPKSFSTDSKAFAGAARLDVRGRRTHSLLRFRIVPCPEELSGKVWSKESREFYEITMANMKEDRRESLDFTFIPCSVVEDVTPMLKELGSSYVFESLRARPGVEPKYIKIYFFTPGAAMLRDAAELLSCGEEMHDWCTCVFDGEMKLLSVTYTFTPKTFQGTPLFTFTL